MERKHLLITLLIITTLTAYYYLAPTGAEPQNAPKVIRILDGDTLELENGLKVRLKGINTPEKGYLYANEAKNLLEASTLGKTIQIRHHGQDRYKRLLAYIFVDGQNINQELIAQGLAHSYYYGQDEYYDDIIASETEARNKKLGIWKKSEHSSCLKIKELDYYDKGDDNETLTLLNACGEPIKVTIKDDATHIYKRTIPEGIYIEHFQNIWNDNGDSIYIWDNEGLVDFYRYQ